MDYPAAFQRDCAVRQGKRQIKVVIDDDDGDLVAQSIEGLEQLLDNRRRQAFERLVKQENPDVAGKCPGYSHHLLFAARKIVSRAIEPFTDSWKILVDALTGPMNTVTGLTLQAAKLQVLFHAHAGEQATALRNITDAELGISGGR